jgi:transketolase
MRNAFIQSLMNIAKQNPRVIMVTGDLGFSVFEPFIAAFPDRYLNAGVAEQNMTGVAAGLAMEGYIPVLYSIIPFATMRNYEQIRNDICYQNLNVKIIGVGAGFSYGTYAHTHHALEDFAIFRTLPNLTILAPGDPVETVWATQTALDLKGPVYVRLGKAGEPNIHTPGREFALGKGVVIQKGRDVTLFTTSTMLETAYEVTKALVKLDISAQLVSIHTIKPLDGKIILKAARDMPIVSIEEHNLIGGLGSAISDVLAANGRTVKYKKFGVKDWFTPISGRTEFMREANGLSTPQLVREISKFVK